MAGMNDYQVFPREYFSGSDVYLAFNNIPIDQIVSIQFSVQEPIIPIYGYASYTYDAVAHGARLVTGSFRINFKEAMYIKSAMAKLSASGISSNNPKTPISDLSSDKAATDMLKWIQGQKLVDIEGLAEEYKQRLWGTKGTTAVSKYSDPFFTTRGSQLSTVGFDIIISYGDELLELNSKYEDFPGTVKMINGVHLTGVSQIVQPTGEAIFEEYSFIGRDLDNTLVKR